MNSWHYRKAIRTFIIDIEHVGDRTYHTLMRSIHEYNLQNSPFTCLNAAVTPAGGYHMILLYKGQKSVRLLFRDSDGYLVAVEDDLGSWYRFKDIPELPFINSAEMKMESGYGDMETSERPVTVGPKALNDLFYRLLKYDNNATLGSQTLELQMKALYRACLMFGEGPRIRHVRRFVSKRFKVFMDLEFPSDLWKLVHNWGLVSN